MQLRALGAHNMESKDTRMECHLIDGVLALDAGSLARSLTFEEQRGSHLERSAYSCAEVLICGGSTINKLASRTCYAS
jgi:hypothetical protein